MLHKIIIRYIYQYFNWKNCIQLSTYHTKDVFILLLFAIFPSLKNIIILFLLLMLPLFLPLSIIVLLMVDLFPCFSISIVIIESLAREIQSWTGKLVALHVYVVYYVDCSIILIFFTLFFYYLMFSTIENMFAIELWCLH